MAATFSEDIQPAYWGLAVILGAGTGVILPLTMVIAQLSTPADLILIASALVIATRSLGGTVGLAVNNALFNSALATEVPRKIAETTTPFGLLPTSIPKLIAGLTSRNATLLGEVPGVSPNIIEAAGAALIQACSVGFRDCWIAAACFIFVAVVVSVFFFDPQDELNEHIDAPAERAVVEKQARIEGHAAAQLGCNAKKSEGAA